MPCEGCIPTDFNSLNYICPCSKFVDSKCVSEIKRKKVKIN